MSRCSELNGFTQYGNCYQNQLDFSFFSKIKFPGVFFFLQSNYICIDPTDCLFGFLTPTSTTILRTGPKTEVRQLYVLPHTRQSGETMTSV